MGKHTRNMSKQYRVTEARNRDKMKRKKIGVVEL